MRGLFDYKKELINLGKTVEEKKNINDSFVRWYLTAEKKDTIPLSNIVNKDDIIYLIQNKKLKTDLITFMEQSQQIFDKYSKDFNKKYNKSLNIYINENQANRLRILYKGKQFEKDKEKLLTIYKLIGIGNIHLSIPPIFKGIELFGSPLNTHNKEYCSPFKIEKKFGSLGSFFNFSFNKNGLYLCNPPFDEKIINDMAVKLLNDLEKTKYDITIFITIPVWDSKSQRKINVKDFNMEFKGYELLINNDFCKEKEIFLKYQFLYWNYYTEKLVSVVNTHVIILSNKNASINISTIRNKWNYFMNYKK